jgi:carbohydrate kinase (thermoresistant glucokinase family)
MSAPYLIMGVSGCGKTSVGQALAATLHYPFFDADDFHPAANRDKMSHGIPLTEEDRAPWLQAIAEKLIAQKDQPFVLACSALRERYRQQLRDACPTLRIIHLHGTRELLLERLQQRKHHFMPASLLESQLAILEIPTDALSFNIVLTPEDIVERIRAHFPP